jgi:probable rRNA maturation factor
MRYQVDVNAAAVRAAVSRRRVAEIARAVLRAERAGKTQLSITFVSSRRIAAINERHLGHRGPTDVISFALQSEQRSGPLSGDIYIAPDVARRNARDHGASIREELTRLVVHGVLHVLGHDHPEGQSRDKSRMWRRQEALVAGLTRGVSAARQRPRISRSAA